jgi:hypothetical protein
MVVSPVCEDTNSMFDLLYVSLLSNIIRVGEVAFKLGTIPFKKKLDTESMC